MLCRRTVSVKVKGKVVPTSFLKIKERGRSLGRRSGKKEQLEKLQNDQNPSPEAPPRCKREGPKRSQERSDCQKSDEKGWDC